MLIRLLLPNHDICHTVLPRPKQGLRFPEAKLRHSLKCYANTRGFSYGYLAEGFDEDWPAEKQVEGGFAKY